VVISFPYGCIQRALRRRFSHISRKSELRQRISATQYRLNHAFFWNISTWQTEILKRLYVNFIHSPVGYSSGLRFGDIPVPNHNTWLLFRRQKMISSDISKCVLIAHCLDLHARPNFGLQGSFNQAACELIFTIDLELRHSDTEQVGKI